MVCLCPWGSDSLCGFLCVRGADCDPVQVQHYLRLGAQEIEQREEDDPDKPFRGISFNGARSLSERALYDPHIEDEAQAGT